jgi:argininosuccinate lyase
VEKTSKIYLLLTSLIKVLANAKNEQKTIKTPSYTQHFMPALHTAFNFFFCGAHQFCEFF